MNSPKETNTNNAVLFAFVGFVVGLIFVGLAMFFALTWLGLPFTVGNLIRLQNSVLFWLLDTLPLVFAILFAVMGNRQDQLARTRQQVDRLSHKHKFDVQRFSDRLATQDQEHKDLEATIGRGKQHWEATFDSVQDLIILTDASGMITRCNRATSDAFQTGFRQLIGRHVDELFPGIAEGSGSAKPAELRFPRLDGWYEVSIAPLVQEGTELGKIFILRNVTDRREAMLDLQRQRQYYELMVNNSPIAIVTLNQDDRIVTCNPAFEALFGHRLKEIVGQDLDSLISSPEVQEETYALSRVVKGGQTARKITRRQRRDGSMVDVEVFGIPVILWGKQVGALALYHDISDLVRAQRAAEAVLPVPPPPAVVEEATLPAESKPVEFARKVLTMETEPETLEEIEEPTLSEKPRRRAVPIETIEGIGPVYAAKLAEVGITTTEDLLERGASRKGREELVEETGIAGKLVLGWVNKADLMRVPGIGEEFSDLLEEAGVNTVKDLRNRNPQNLYNALVQAKERKPLVRRVPSQNEVEGWVKAAKELEPRMSY